MSSANTTTVSVGVRYSNQFTALGFGALGGLVGSLGSSGMIAVIPIPSMVKCDPAAGGFLSRLLQSLRSQAIPQILRTGVRFLTYHEVVTLIRERQGSISGHPDGNFEVVSVAGLSAGLAGGALEHGLERGKGGVGLGLKLAHSVPAVWANFFVYEAAVAALRQSPYRAPTEMQDLLCRMAAGSLAGLASFCVYVPFNVLFLHSNALYAAAVSSRDRQAQQHPRLRGVPNLSAVPVPPPSISAVLESVRRTGGLELLALFRSQHWLNIAGTAFFSTCMWAVADY